MIIAVDFDDTLIIHGRPNVGLIAALKQRQANGDEVILWTCRSGAKLDEAVRFLLKNGFAPNLINRNSPAAIRKYGGDTRKVYADIYIDDKAVKP